MAINFHISPTCFISYNGSIKCSRLFFCVKMSALRTLYGYYSSPYIEGAVGGIMCLK